MELGLTSDKINRVSIYDKPYLYWNVGFHYYIKILELENRYGELDPVAVYLESGSITYEEELKETETGEVKENIVRTITKSKIYKTGVKIFNKLKFKIGDKICEEWCKHAEILNIVTPVFTDSLFNQQSTELIKAVEWVFANAASFKIEIPEMAFIAGGAVAIAVLFYKINKSFSRLCNCEKIKKYWKEQEKHFEKGIPEDIKIKPPIKNIQKTTNTHQEQKQKNPIEEMIEILKMRLAQGKISVKEYEQLRKIIES